MSLERRFHGVSSALIEERKDLNPDYVKQVVRQGMSFMPSFRKTEITDTELTVLAGFVTHSRTDSEKDGVVQGKRLEGNLK
jgi:hypothetical protein